MFCWLSFACERVNLLNDLFQNEASSRVLHLEQLKVPEIDGILFKVKALSVKINLKFIQKLIGDLRISLFQQSLNEEKL